jgi:hypothetical protein
MFNRLCYTTLFFLFIIQGIEGKSLLPAERNSLFANGRWIKIETSSTGIHRMYFSWLRSIGFLHPQAVKLYGSRNEPMSLWNAASSVNGPVQIPTLRFNDGGGDESLLFYVQGSTRWKYDPVSGQYYPLMNQSSRGKSWFYLTEDLGNDLTIPAVDTPSGKPIVKTTSYDDFGISGEEKINLLESGRRWFSALLTGGNVLNYKMVFPDRIESEAVTLKVYAAGRSSVTTGMEVSLNGNALGTMPFDPVQQASDGNFASADSFRTTRISPGADIDLSFRYIGAPPDQSWFDYTTVQLRRNLQYRGTPLVFRESRNFGNDKITEYQINGVPAGLLLWDITNPLLPGQMNYQFNNGQIICRAKSDTLRNFLLFDPRGQYPGLTKIEEVRNADLLHMGVPQFLIITPNQFLDQANRLADFHRQTDGLSVGVVTIESVFNEFSGGYPEIPALRDFIRELYQQNYTSGGSTLKYLLLFGKGTCDPVHEPDENNPDWIPSFQSENSLNTINSFVTDDFFGLMGSGEGDQFGNVAIGIGRIPAVTLDEATVAVDKIIHYHDAGTLGSWRNNITFIGDDEDNNVHVNDSEELASMVNKKNPEYRTSKIYLDAYPQVLTPEERYPAVNEAIRRSVQVGDLIVNYIGHAGADGLAQEKVLTTTDIDAWTNKDRLPLFVTATCEFSRWDMTMKRSAGEHLYFHRDGGAIALLSATRLVYSASNFGINKSFFDHAFDRDSLGAPLRLGDLIRLVKNENSGTVNTLKFCLIGDPALSLDYPEYHCKNLEINHQPIEQFNGFLSPLSQVSIDGAVQDSKGQNLENFNGTLSAMVFDQPTEKMTLGNGGLPPFSYLVQDNLLFNGEVPVKNGVFTYSFFVPKDVNFNENAGMIRYYFSNGKDDGNGSFAAIHFNGTAMLPDNDHIGPAITLFLENENFHDGGRVSPNPLLLVYLSDESGINTSNSGIGHDIIFSLDGLTTNPVVLNGFYQSGPDSWKSGSIFYPLSTLATGEHSLTLRAWDNADNSSAVTIRFVVSKDLIISNVYNFPNPFYDQTRFVITQNRFDELLEVNLEIMDLSGRKIHSSHQLLVSQGYVISDLYWVPKQLDPIPANGVYLYRITLTDPEGNRAWKSGRLILKE